MTDPIEDPDVADALEPAAGVDIDAEPDGEAEGADEDDD